MSKILVVDDEDVYQRQLAIALTPDGHDVRTAGRGRDAIDLGARYRPDVLVTDWMLKNDIHGVHVAQVLRSVMPSLRVIMITGFPSDDLRADAHELGAVDFIEKPFSLDRMKAAVGSKHAKPPPQNPSDALPVFEVDEAGNILFANSLARLFFAETHAGPGALSLADLFAPSEKPELNGAIDRWVAASPRTARKTFWHIRSQAPRQGGTRLVVLRRQGDAQNLGHALVAMLLGGPRAQPARWLLSGHVLVIEPEEIMRRVSVSMLESCGAACYAAQNLETAMRLLEADRRLCFIILDHDLPGVYAAVERIRSMRSDITLIGTSKNPVRDAFAALGVELFVQKPWRGDDVINLLLGRLGDCVECGLTLPLRRPKPAETAELWACVYCGACYHALFDPDAVPDTLANARRVATNHHDG